MTGGRRYGRHRFRLMVGRALARLPRVFRDRLENVVVLVDEEPPAFAAEPDTTLFGLYEGTPLPERGSGYSFQLPDRITLFRGPIERACRTDAQLLHEIRATVVHEVGHFFGLSDAEIEEAMGE